MTSATMNRDVLREPKSASRAGVRGLARLDIQGGGQVVVEDGYAYVGHMRPPDGTSIIDVRDPSAPRLVAQIPPPSPRSHTHKVRVVGNLLFANVEQDRRHFLRKAEGIAPAEAQLRGDLGRAPNEAEIAAKLGVDTDQLADLRKELDDPYDEGGFRIFDISDRAQPRLLVHHRTGGVGVHRFDVDDRYAYISTEMPGYLGNILMIYDIADPSAPQEVSRWHMPGQHVGAGETPDWEGRRTRLHHALREGDTLWAAYWHGGAVALDISDIRAPKEIGRHNYHPPFPEPTHTFLKLPEPIGGRDIAVICDEEHDHIPGQPHAFLWVMDVSDPSAITPISTFHLGTHESPYALAEGRFGLHQVEEVVRGTELHAAWFSGGLRIIDLADPERPTEIGHYVPEPIGDHPTPQSNDVAVDDNGVIYLLDRDRGLEILEPEAM